MLILLKRKGSRIRHILITVLLYPGLSLNEAFLSKLDEPVEKQSKYGGMCWVCCLTASGIPLAMIIILKQKSI